MSNKRGQHVDTTFLSVNQAESRGFLHRDYIAHCLRWTHVVKRLYEKSAYSHARILDVGCGREVPFGKLLYSSRLIPERYVGVDVGPINDGIFPEDGKFRPELFAYGDIMNITFEEGLYFTHVICFEVLEHVEPEHMIRMLTKIRVSLDLDGRAFISTPCWNLRDTAANHVNEMTYEALGAVFEDRGWTIVDVHGTFASISDYKEHLIPAHAELFDDLRAYYDTNFLSCILAPFYPAYSRNCLWELSPHTCPDGERRFPTLSETRPPWGSSERWEEMQT